MIHSNPVLVADGMLTVDRKFHTGMLNYAEHLKYRIITVNPLARASGQIMDGVTVPLVKLPYAVEPVQCDLRMNLEGSEVKRLRQVIAGSALVYGNGFGAAKIARELAVPYIPMIEYDLQTQITVTTAGVRNLAKRAVRTARCLLDYTTVQLSDISRAHSVHCNGYPIFDVASRYNPNTLLYLDSRMSRDMIISDEELRQRCYNRPGRPLRLLYSGRYERMKGADDAVMVALACFQQGLDIEMHCYGQGSLKPSMLKLASARADRIHIHDAVPYPQLVQIARTFDLFVCCHIQNDPSCTYLESIGAGLPIAGYANKMWLGLLKASGAGVASPLHRHRMLAALIRDSLGQLSEMSHRAVAFARAHNFEREFARRIAALNDAI